jgi:hypothetical protein
MMAAFVGTGTRLATGLMGFRLSMHVDDVCLTAQRKAIVCDRQATLPAQKTARTNSVEKTIEKYTTKRCSGIFENNKR